MASNTMVTTQSKQMTLEEFLALPETKPASEFIDGKIIQKPMPKGKHSIIQAELIITLNADFRAIIRLAIRISYIISKYK